MPRHPAVLVATCLLALTVSGCGSSGSTPAASTPAASDLQLAIAVAGRTVTPAPGTVTASPGQTVTLTLTSDRAGELHVHGAAPELDAAVSPGTKVYTFTLVDQPGVYEIEMHDPDLLLTSIKVQ